MTRAIAKAAMTPPGTTRKSRCSPTPRAQIIDPRTAYQIVSILQGVVQRGTGQSVLAVGKPVAGKTGTSSDSQSAWFVGFSPDLAAGVYVGFDDPRTLGKDSIGEDEQGATVAAPIFRDFMKGALADQPPTPSASRRASRKSRSMPSPANRCRPARRARSWKPSRPAPRRVKPMPRAAE